MSQVSRWTAPVALGLAVAVLIFVGCNNGRDNPTGGVDAGSTRPTTNIKKTDEAPAEDGPLLAHWKTGPEDHFEGALILTGQMIGYLEPCGCSAKQKGGLVRRAVFVEKLRQQGWDLALLDLGGLVSPPDKARGGPEQAKIKYATTLKALLELGYDALALSADDLRLGTAEILMQDLNTLPASADALKIVAANVQPTPGLDFETRVRPSVRTQVGSIKVGVTAVLDPESFEALNDPDKSALLTVQSPEEALPAVLADLKKDTNLQVLLVQGPPEMALKMARAYPDFDIVVGTSEVPDPPAKPEEINGGQTQLITVGKKGMYLGVLGLYTDPEQKFRYQRIELNDRYDKYQDLAAPMKQLIGDDLQATLKTARVLQTYPKRPYALFGAPGDATYVGAETCKQCHPGTYAKWSQTKHAHAYEVLVSDPHDPKRNREHDAMCISCHTTGFEYNGGFLGADLTPNLKGNQCENCHGPGSKHAANPDDPDILKTVAREATFFEKSLDSGCMRCHDGDNDPNFNFATYWPKIMHKGLDTYDDPKVHQGIDASEGTPKSE